jgi:phosphoribosyl 1,2-cyclic phosphodiesterase
MVNMSSEGTSPVPAGVPDDFSVHFLSSGSSGNCHLIFDGTETILLDFGLNPGLFLTLVRSRGVAVDYWKEKTGKAPKQTGRRISAAILTHLHSDHFCASTLRVLSDNGIKLFLHDNHALELEENRTYRKMRDAGFVQAYGTDLFRLTSRTTVQPIEVPHDSPSTTSFLFECRRDGHSRPVRFGYFSDLGYFAPRLAPLAANCDLLALEFNHDVEMERRSGRHPRMIARVLGTHGHLSNEQAAEALRLIVAQSDIKPASVALLHLSRDCNTPALAHSAAKRALAQSGASAEILVTRQREYAGFINLFAPREATREPSVAPQAPAVFAPALFSSKNRAPSHIVQDLFD